MDTSVTPLHLLLPLILGVLLRWRRAGSPRPIVKRCALAGLAYSLVHIACFVLVDALWIPRVQLQAQPADVLAEALGFALGYTFISVVLSIAGGTGLTWLATAFRGQHPSGPVH
jgi:hypothetical protein